MAKLVSVNNNFPTAINLTGKPFSPRLLNWVEPIDVNGVLKTLIYTEVDSNMNVGDMVFIINGNYDSDLLVKSDKYKKGTDGYRILAIDKCKITLDIDFTGVMPWNDDPIDNYIKVYQINNSTEFIYVNRQLTSKNGTLDYKFNPGNDSVVFSSAHYGSISGFGQTTGLGLGPTRPGFYIKNGTGRWTHVINTSWSDLSDFPTYLGTYSSGSSNERIKIMRGTFTLYGNEYKEGFVYKYENGEWVVDVTHHRPFITKANFRDGLFKGAWSAGVFGRQDKKIEWDGSGTWDNGTLLNTLWDSGEMNSSYTSKESYYGGIDEYGLPYQKINPKNNRGFGYNYVVNSEINQSDNIYNGNFYDTLVGLQPSTFSVVENYVTSITQSLSININKGEFNNCSFESSQLSGSEIKNSRLNNSNITTSKSVNSHYTDSLFYRSNFNSDNIIKVLAYDKWVVNVNPSTASEQSIIYKFYISEDNYDRIKFTDQVYINGVVVDNNVLNFFDRKFILNNYFYHDDAVPGPVRNATEYTVSLSTSVENKYIMSGTLSTTLNNNQLPSFNIHIATQSDAWIGTVDVTNAYIIDSDFRSGLVEKSNWNSGNIINHNYDNTLPQVNTTSGDYQILITTIGDNKLSVTMSSIYINDNIIKVGSIVYLNSVDNITATGSAIPLSDTYKVVSITYGSGPFHGDRAVILEEIGSSIIPSLTQSQFKTTYNTVAIGNRYNYIHPAKINNSNILSGKFRRSYIKNSIVYNNSYNNQDIDFSNITLIKNLLFTEMIFRGGGNSINSGIYIYSFFIDGSDTWNNGIFYNSDWTGSTFSNGVFRESRWNNGTFENGVFYKSNSGGYLSNPPAPLYYTYNTNRFQSFWRAGNISNSTLLNNRYSWLDGNFNGGEFYKSGFESGIFNNGKFYLSEWFAGTFSNGVMGDKSLSDTDTNFYNGTIEYAIVENANIYAKNTIDILNSPGYPTSSPKNIMWKDGIFKAGIFGSLTKNKYNNFERSIATWSDGQFNGGNFQASARWLTGTFNGGKFTSDYGWTMSSSTYSTNYSWSDGIFNDGEFGNANGSTNSTWYTGEFNGGTFKGRVWNNGVFTSGNFEGSGTYSVISPLGTTCSNPSKFTDSFTNSYYGLWRNGTVTDTKDKFIKDRKIWTDIQRSYTEKRILKNANINNTLWVTGTFSHPSGVMNNCVWLDGQFQTGTFKNSSFNPYVKRIGATQSSFNLDDNTCFWENGSLDNSDFYISEWNDGKFLLGTAVGMIWKNGVANYMNAYNVFWENGTWRNGNWYGSAFSMQGDGSVTDDYTRQIVFRGMSWSGTSSCHVWNIFTEDATDPLTIINATASSDIVDGL